jgi:MFS family permease
MAGDCMYVFSLESAFVLHCEVDFLTQGGLILFVGQVLRLFPKKTVYLSSTALFEIGSLICALANSMPLFIAGRAVAGCGAAG